MANLDWLRKISIAFFIIIIPIILFMLLLFMNMMYVKYTDQGSVLAYTMALAFILIAFSVFGVFYMLMLQHEIFKKESKY